MEDWFIGWARLHCEATGADDATARALLANRAAFVETWGATAAELGECTRRLVARRRVPKFANEHSDAIGNELHHLYAERNAQSRPSPADTDRPPACYLCRDRGLVVVPHLNCVEAPRNDPPRLVFYRDRNLEYGYVMEVSVRCDLHGCLAGRRLGDDDAKRPEGERRLTVDGYARQLPGGLTPVDAIDLLARHNTELAREARRTAGPVAGPLGGVLASLAAKARAGGTHTEDAA